MPDKYAAKASQARRRARRDRSCKFKHRYASEVEAMDRWNGNTYACRHCDGWHRTGEPVSKLRRIPRRKPRK